jgi:hypothetical protein
MGFSFLWKRSSDPMHRLGVGIFFGLCGIFLQSITEWTFRQTHIFLTFNLLVGALAGLRYARRRAKRRLARPAAAAKPVRALAGAPAEREQPCVSFTS